LRRPVGGKIARLQSQRSLPELTFVARIELFHQSGEIQYIAFRLATETLEDALLQIDREGPRLSFTPALMAWQRAESRSLLAFYCQLDAVTL